MPTYNKSMHTYHNLERIQSKIEACERFLQGIEAGEHPAQLKQEAEKDLRYWLSELDNLQR